MLEQRYQAEVELRAAKVGQFDVLADDQLVFSKQQAGRFPEHDEILAAVDALGQKR